ncbi:MAG: TlpA disulfide reductase family protein, partial [Bacteroidota bacterium]
NLEPDANVAWLYLENSQIEMEADFWKSEQNGIMYNIMQVKSIKGSTSEDILSAFRKYSKEHESADAYPELIHSYLADLIKEYPQESIVGKILADISLTGDVLSADQLKGLLEKLSTEHQQNSDIQIIQTALVGLESLKIGDSFLEFNLPDQNGEKVSNDQLKGKFTLIDFWASWCAPCRAQNPELTQLLEKYGQVGFEVLGISIDRDAEGWKQAIEEDQMNWQQLLDVDEELQKALGIQAIPLNYLLDKEGKVIGKNLTLEEVDKVVSKELFP